MYVPKIKHTIKSRNSAKYCNHTDTSVAFSRKGRKLISNYNLQSESKICELLLWFDIILNLTLLTFQI